MFWLFGGEGEKDGCAMNDRVVPSSFPGACFRRFVGETADVCRREAISDDYRGRLFADGVAVFPRAEVQRSDVF